MKYRLQTQHSIKKPYNRDTLNISLTLMTQHGSQFTIPVVMALDILVNGPFKVINAPCHELYNLF